MHTAREFTPLTDEEDRISQSLLMHGHAARQRAERVNVHSAREVAETLLLLMSAALLAWALFR